MLHRSAYRGQHGGPSRSRRKQDTRIMTFRPLSRLTLALAAATLLAGAVQADELRPARAASLDLGPLAGVAYYTAEPDGHHVVVTLAPAGRGHRPPASRRCSPPARASLGLDTAPGKARRAARFTITRQGETTTVEAVAVRNPGQRGAEMIGGGGRPGPGTRVFPASGRATSPSPRRPPLHPAQRRGRSRRSANRPPAGAGGPATGLRSSQARADSSSSAVIAARLLLPNRRLSTAL